MKIVPSSRREKKFMAIFDDGKVVHFGASGYSDFTLHKNEARKQRYIARHTKREDWDNPRTAGALSRWILWNKPTIKASIEDYYARFGKKLEK